MALRAPNQRFRCERSSRASVRATERLAPLRLDGPRVIRPGQSHGETDRECDKPVLGCPLLHQTSAAGFRAKWILGRGGGLPRLAADKATAKSGFRIWGHRTPWTGFASVVR